MDRKLLTRVTCAKCGAPVDPFADNQEHLHSDLTAEQVMAWLDKNTTFYDVTHDDNFNISNVPALASVSKRIWYHATDDQLSWPFSKVVKHSVTSR